MGIAQPGSVRRNRGTGEALRGDLEAVTPGTNTD
jgi:hypothetical protein